MAAAAAGLVWWVYVAANTGPSRHLLDRLTAHIQHQGFAEEWGARIAAFALGEAGWFVLFLGLSAGVVACILTGVLRGRRAVWAWVVLCAIMICDLSRADQPWVRYFNYQEKYADNDIVKILRQEPWEHRVAAEARAQWKRLSALSGRLWHPGQRPAIGGWKTIFPTTTSRPLTLTNWRARP